MGKLNNVINRYLDDERRFADLFNGIWFRGKGIIKPKDLLDCSERYIAESKSFSADNGNGKYSDRTRDIKKRLSDGKTLRILAIENQNLVDYTMPFRCMEYDTLEYGKQLASIRKANREANLLSSSAEKLCGIRKTDRLAPVYTICLYHGEEKWDGPRTLKDMMDFGEEEDKFFPYFKDYPMHLYCINEMEDFSVFHTDLKELFTALQFRKNQEALERLLKENEKYSHLEVDTAEAMAVMLNLSEKWIKTQIHKFKNEKEEYDMCQAIREWSAKERAAGRQEGRQEGRKEGRREGRQEGIFLALCSLVRDGLLQLEEAAKRSQMSVDDFRVRMEQKDIP